MRRIENLEKRLAEHAIWLVKEGMNRDIELITNARTLKQFVVGLSIAILGVAFPNLVGNLSDLPKDMIIVAFTMFCITTVWGLVSLVVPTIKELREMPSVSNHHIDQTKGLLREVQEIKRMEDNALAGQRYEGLATKYMKLDLGQPSRVQLLWHRYEDILLYALFIVAFILTSIGAVIALY